MDPLFFRVGKTKVFPVDIVGIICMCEFQRTAIVDKSMRISLVLIKEIILIVLVLERNKGMSNEVSQVEQKTVIGCILIVQNNPTIVDKLYLLGNRRKSILILAIPYLIYQLVALLLLAALLLD